MGALVDRVEPVVAVMLFDVVFAGVAVAAVHLDRQVVGFQTPLRRPALGDGREDVEQVLVVAEVDQPRAVQRERQRTLDVGLLRQQHPLDVGVLDDRHLRVAGSFAVTGLPCGRSLAYCSDFR